MTKDTQFAPDTRRLYARPYALPGRYQYRTSAPWAGVEPESAFV